MLGLKWAVLAALLVGSLTAGPVVKVVVPGTSNPYLAGMPRGTTARYNDVAPEQSPVLVNVSLVDAVAVSFTAKGEVEHGPYDPPEYTSPNGSSMIGHVGGAEHGISDIAAPYNSLVGVFLDDERPDRTKAPNPLEWRGGGKDVTTVAPELKQVFLIGNGVVKRGVRRRYLVPKGATRLFLGTMDSFEWSNNQGSFRVTVEVERTNVSVKSSITFREWPCLPDRSQCTPERVIVKETGAGEYHVVLPAQLEWGASVASPAGASVSVTGATGIVCLDAESRRTSSCNGPAGNGSRGGAGFAVAGEGVGALVRKTEGGRTYFSVNDRAGEFAKHEGYFEFDVVVK